jgi:putative heme-binding domain-containing protein
MMYFTTGGRNTTGGVWRLRYNGTDAKAPDMTGILAVVRQPQPLSSWGWAAIEKIKTSMGASFATELQRLARNASAETQDRVRAILELQRHGPAPAAELLKTLASDRNADVRAAAVFVAGFQGPSANAVPPAALKDSSPFVRRRAAEALVRMGQSPDRPSLAPVADIYALLNDEDRFVRWAGRIALERTPRAKWKDKVLAEKNPLGLFEGMLAFVRTAKGDDLQPLIERQLAMLQQRDLSLENKLRLYRTFMYTTTEVSGGLTAAQRQKLHASLVDQFPANDERLNREMALMLAYAGQPEAIGEILAVMPKGDENQPLQLHYLYALRTIKEGWSTPQKMQIADLLGRAAKWRGGFQFMNFVASMYEAVEGLFTTEEEEKALHEKAPDFAPLTPEELEEIQQRQAASGRGRGNQPPPAVVARRQGRVLSRQEMLEEAVYQPQQKLDRAEGQQLFEKNCAACHRFGSIGNDHGVAGLNLTTSPLLASKYALLEAIMFPDRKLAPEHETTAFEMTDGTTIHALVLKETPQGTAVLTREGTAADLQKGQIKARRKIKTSLMTEAMADAMNQSQWRNLLAFLTAAPPPASSSQLPVSSFQVPAPN